MSPPSIPAPRQPTHLGCHRTSAWASSVIQEIPTGYLFKYDNMYVSMLLSQFIPPSPFPAVCPQACSLCLCLYCCLAIGSSESKTEGTSGVFNCSSGLHRFYHEGLLPTISPMLVRRRVRWIPPWNASQVHLFLALKYYLTLEISTVMCSLDCMPRLPPCFHLHTWVPITFLKV